MLLTFSGVKIVQPACGGSGGSRGATFVPASESNLYFLYKYEPSTSTTLLDFPSLIISQILQSKNRKVVVDLVY